MPLKGKVAFVTAGAGGVGREIAMVFAGEGANVAIADIDPEAAKACARDIDPTGLHVIGLGMDVADEAQVESAAGQVVEAFGALDVLVNVIGAPVVALAGDAEPLEWKRLLAIQLDCAFVTTRAALQQMYRQGRGSIVYVGSAPARGDANLVSPYARLRRGLVALATAVERDGVALGVRATTIWPGFASRPTVEAWAPGRRPHRDGVPFEAVTGSPRTRRVAEASSTARDVAEAAVFLGLPIATRGLPAPRPSARLDRRAPDERINSAASPDACSDRVLDLAVALLPMGLCTLERVARQMGLDPRTLQRRLARQGVSFGDIVDNLRADQAARYLREGDLSLTEVAEALGFSALSAFSRWFRHHFGCSATAWRRLELAPIGD